MSEASCADDYEDGCALAGHTACIVDHGRHDGESHIKAAKAESGTTATPSRSGTAVVLYCLLSLAVGLSEDGIRDLGRKSGVPGLRSVHRQPGSAFGECKV